MKLLSFSTEYQDKIGVLLGDKIAVITSSSLPSKMIELIQAGPKVWNQVRAVLKSGRVQMLDASSVTILPPIRRPGKIIGIGLNYKDHCREQNVPFPDRPVVFTKFTTAIIGPDEPICWDMNVTNQVDYEVELGVVIGKKTRCVSVDKALEYVFGYTIINDVSARDLQFSDRQWVRAKSMDTFCPFGPVIVTADEIPDPQNLHLSCKLNDEVMQNSSTSEMVFGVAEIISRLSQSFTFEPGDIIATGTPDGVGVYRKPQVFLKDGDRLSLEIEGIGRLENYVKLGC
jgi:2-keto-4-pentenoate hydratase/2-oxohepta-3-ene-1,7-dioic acid hydratase in catechol pathway